MIFEISHSLGRGWTPMHGGEKFALKRVHDQDTEFGARVKVSVGTLTKNLTQAFR